MDRTLLNNMVAVRDKDQGAANLDLNTATTKVVPNPLGNRRWNPFF